MADSEELALLREIRDLTRRHLELYEKASSRSFAFQEQAIEKQARSLSFYKWVVMVTAVVLFPLVALLAYRLLRP